MSAATPQAIAETTPHFPADFEAIYRAHFNKVMAVCVTMTGDRSLAEDLAQETFIQAARKLASYRGDAQLSTWIHRIAVNAVLMHFRKGYVRRELTTPTGAMPDYLRQSAHPEKSLNARIDLGRAMATLPKGYLHAFINREVLGLNHLESAALAGTCEGTSKSQLFKAHKKMRAHLPGYEK